MHPGRMCRVEEIQSPPRDYAMHLDYLTLHTLPSPFSLPCYVYVCACMYVCMYVSSSGIVCMYMLPYVYFVPLVKVEGENVGNPLSLESFFFSVFKI